ncbi:MAG: serine hydrolase domain-containing protein, partial [Bacteroidota bacterium]
FSYVSAQDMAQRVNDYASSYVNTSDFSGCILITEKGETIYENCFGFANRAFQVANDPTTKFKIGSISKQFTAAAILIMEQDGLLHTDDLLSKFFPTYANAEKITIQQLLTHTAGVSDIYSIPDFNKLSYQKTSIADLAKLVLEAALVFAPGTQYQYSNGGYAVLADIIEKGTGKTYQEYLHEKIFKPLNMTASGHNKGSEVVANLAVGYDPIDYNGVKFTDYLDPELLKGGGSLYSTVHDLLIWIQSLKDRSLLTAESYDKLLHNYGHNYGFGISLYSSFDQAVFGHDGRVNGYIADYLHYKESDHTIIVLGNLQTGVADFFRRDVAAIVFGEAYASKAKTTPVAAQPLGNPEKILGTYAFGPSFNVYVEQIDGSIQARANEGAYSELIELENQRFFSRTLYSYIEFVADEKGQISKMIWINNDGNRFEGLKQ